ncbi:hypothetical protein FRB96_007040 [Tulasnella sp. 330]|nr:hypothetical protein FRB96_007040 [Tulasnella sp. 330]
MRFSTLTTLSVFTLAAQAIYIPTPGYPSEVARRGQDISARCDPSCSGSSGSSGSSSSTSANIDLSYSTSFSTVGELTCLASSVNIFLSYADLLTAAAKADVVAKIATIAAWSAADITTLDNALVAVKTSGSYAISSTFVDICTKAQISLSITAAEIDCLRAFIATTLTVDFGIAVANEVSIYNWCNNVVGYTSAQLTSLAAQITTSLHVVASSTVSTGASTGAATTTVVTTTVAASLSGVIALRAKLLVYVQGLLVSADLLTKVKLIAIVTEIQLWIIGSVVTTTDYSTCLNLMKQVSSCGYSSVETWDLSAFGSIATTTHA